MIDSTSAFRTNGRYYTWCNKKQINNNLENFPAWPLQSRTVWRHDVHSLRRSDKEPNPSLPDVQSSSWKYFCQLITSLRGGQNDTLEWHFVKNTFQSLCRKSPLTLLKIIASISSLKITFHVTKIIELVTK